MILHHYHRRIGLQAFFWGMVWMCLPFLLANGMVSYERLLVRGLTAFFLNGLLVYLNLKWLMPFFLLRQRYGFYFASAVGLAVTVVLLINWEGMPWADWMLPDGKPAFSLGTSSSQGGSPLGFRVLGRMMSYIVSLIGSALIELAIYAHEKEGEAMRLQKEKLETEVKFLKSQINPHFLFNTLNNIYTLSIIKSEAASENLLRLSEMLRYMLYDCSTDKVPLRKEIAYIRHFVGLWMLKDSRGLNIQMRLDESRPELPVAPMLFIPLVENAFKHSKVEDIEKGWITIEMTTTDERLTFEVKNSMPDTNYSKDMTGGIGLENVRRQLELLYPGRHELITEAAKDHFLAKLTLITNGT